MQVNQLFAGAALVAHHKYADEYGQEQYLEFQAANLGLLPFLKLIISRKKVIMPKRIVVFERIHPIFRNNLRFLLFWAAKKKHNRSFTPNACFMPSCGYCGKCEKPEPKVNDNKKSGRFLENRLYYFTVKQG